MGRILFIVTSALFIGSSSLAADEDRASNGFQTNLTTYHEDGFDEGKPVPWVGNNGQLTNLGLTTEGKLKNGSLGRTKSLIETYIGPGVAPLFGTYSVLRTNGKQDGSSYVAFGFNLDEWVRDEADRSYSGNNSDLSFGFGVNNTLFNIEYMMYVSEESNEISAISLGYISEF